HRLELLTAPTEGGHLTDRLLLQEGTAWQGFLDGIDRLTGYLAEHHPEEYGEIVRRSHVPPEDGGPESDYFMNACLRAYRANFDPSVVAAEIERLEGEHDALMRQWADLPTAYAREKARARFGELEARIEGLRRQQEDAAEVVTARYREVNDLAITCVEARAS